MACSIMLVSPAYGTEYGHTPWKGRPGARDRISSSDPAARQQARADGSQKRERQAGSGASVFRTVVTTGKPEASHLLRGAEKADGQTRFIWIMDIRAGANALVKH
ncbi:hypothetical protein [Roseibium algae]|uniref:Uncharacterized protein n=1 Tax=Roseibium algae TaxID=3123038 RepID=A0ABU8TEQ7_9HYPH